MNAALRRPQGAGQCAAPPAAARAAAAAPRPAAAALAPPPARRPQRQQPRARRRGRGAAAPPAAAALPAEAYALAEGLEAPVQAAYLLTLLGFLSAGAFLVVRQVLIRRELEEAAKVLAERVRGGDAAAEDHFELGVILLRKKLYTQAAKNLERAKKGWAGEPEELAQVHNALGYAAFNTGRFDDAAAEYAEATRLQPGYVTAWNNLGDALEKLRRFDDALAAYREALALAPDNAVARARADFCATRLQRASGGGA